MLGCTVTMAKGSDVGGACVRARVVTGIVITKSLLFMLRVLAQFEAGGWPAL